MERERQSTFAHLRFYFERLPYVEELRSPIGGWISHILAYWDRNLPEACRPWYQKLVDSWEENTTTSEPVGIC